MTFSSMKVVFGNRKNAANRAKLYCSEYGFYQSGSFRSDYEWNQFKTKNDFANAIKRYLKNPNTCIERLEIDNSVAPNFRDEEWRGCPEIVLLNMLLDELKG
jgi:hypothetical protein